MMEYKYREPLFLREPQLFTSYLIKEETWTNYLMPMGGGERVAKHRASLCASHTAAPGLNPDSAEIFLLNIA